MFTLPNLNQDTSWEKLQRQCGIGTIWYAIPCPLSPFHSRSNLSQDLADIAFRLSDDSGLASSTLIQQQSPQVNSPEIQEGPITSLTHALITRPKLRTFCTLLPSLWNETILRISSNPNLECIVLGDGTYRHARSTSLYFDNGPAFDAGSGGIVGTGLFLTQAKKHARLSDLIRAGTYVYFYLFLFCTRSYHVLSAI